MTASREPIAVIGTGYVGLVTAAGFAELGNEVHCVDVDADKVARLQRGEVPIYEPGLAEVLERHAERMHFTTDLAPALDHARLLFVAVGTPPTYSGDADLSAVHAVVAALPASDTHALVMKSTVPCGTGASIKRSLAKEGRGLAYVSCPEFLKEGSALADFRAPDRVVVGDDGNWAGDAVVDLYAPLDAPVVRTDITSAEMVKLASNAFLATKISFINEIANVCEELGADVEEVALGMGMDARIGPSFLRPGVGYGGSCLAGDESVVVRIGGRTTSTTFERLWRRLEVDERILRASVGVLEPLDLEVLSWDPETEEPGFERVTAATRRPYLGDAVEVTIASGSSVTCTPDHPWVVGVGSEKAGIQSAASLVEGHSVPLVTGIERGVYAASVCSGPFPGEPPSPTSTALLDARRSGTQATWTRVARAFRRPFEGHVYSLEVERTQTFVTTGGVVVHNCFPKDVEALKQLAGNSGYHFQLLTAVIEVNELQKRRVVGKLHKHLGELVGKRVALLGLAFKPDTDDMREASSLVLAARLQSEGATVVAYDPVAAEEARALMPGVTFAGGAVEAIAEADACVLVTEWPEFAEMDWDAVSQAMAGTLVVDGRNALDPAAVRAAGLTYEGVGRR